jgi:putative membrane-bound dehydrogenase-like protein
MNKHVSADFRPWNRFADHRSRLKSLLCVCVLLCWGSSARAQDFADELPRIPPTEPEQALQTFTVADGFKLELVAREPLIGTPVAIEWDADGRMFVCEMRGYSEDRDEAISRIALLTDDDDDGRYDRRTTFADGLLWPTAIFPYDGGLFVGDAPHLYYFKDTDGDGKADEKKLVLTGFGTSNVQGLMNSMRWGLDNRIHIACSSTGGQIRRGDAGEDAQRVNVRGRDIAFDPRSYEFQPTSGAAQHGMCFDDWGRKFVSSNSDHIQQVMYEDHNIARNPYLRAPSSRISIAADGPQAEVYRSSPVEPWRIVRTRLRVAGEVPGPVEGGGRAAGYFTGATGVTIYRGDRWPAGWKGFAFIGDVGSNLVHRKRLDPNGLQYVAKRIDEDSEFITSSDIWFRPAQFANAPDGSLHVIDVCREVIEHPKSLPPAIKQHLDLTAGRDRGRIYRIVPSDDQGQRKTVAYSKAPTETLVGLLGHANAWHRETAARLLYERQDKAAIPLLKKFTTDSRPLARLHAMYALDGQHALDAETLLPRLQDPHPQVRRHAVRLAGDASEIADKLVAMTGDDSLAVRYELAFALGDVTHDKKVAALTQLLRRDPTDKWIQTAVQSSLSDDAAAAFEQLAGDVEFWTTGGESFLKNLASQIGAQNRQADVTLAVKTLSELPAAVGPRSVGVISELVKARNRRGSVLQQLAAAGKLKGLDARIEALIRQAIDHAGDATLPVASRIAAVEAMSLASANQALPTLATLVDNRQPHDLQRAAIVAMGAYQDDRVAPVLIKAWSNLSPRLRDVGSEVLFARPERIARLLDAMDSGEMKPSAVSRARMQLAAKSKNTDLAQRAAAFLQQSSTGRRDDVLAKYRAALTMQGDAARGRDAFKQHCSVCHKVAGVGHELGPNLATMKSRGADAILANVIDPNAEVNPQYLNYIVLTDDGNTLTGMITAESATAVTLTRAENAKDTVLRVNIEQLQSSGVSIMPEGLEEKINVQTMADIITYLLQVN